MTKSIITTTDLLKIAWIYKMRKVYNDTGYLQPYKMICEATNPNIKSD